MLITHVKPSGTQGPLRRVDIAGCGPQSRDCSRNRSARTCLPLYVPLPNLVSTWAADCRPQSPGDFLSILSEIERNYLWVDPDQQRSAGAELTSRAYRLDDGGDGSSSVDGMTLG
jgi:hypothetical protein